MTRNSMIINLTARLDGMEAGLSKAASMNASAVAQIERQWDSAASGIKRALASVGVTLAAGALTSMFRNLLDGIDALNDLSDATGASVEKLSALENTALRAGGNIDTVETALLKLNTALKDAKPDNDVGKALASIGLNAAELRRLDPADALDEVAKAFNAYQDGGDKARTMQDIFGKSTREVAALLKDLAEDGRRNATVTREQAEAVDTLNKRFAQLEASSSTAARSLALEFVPALNRMASELADGLKHYQNFIDYVIDVGFTNPSKSINETLSETATRIRKVGEEMDAIKARQSGGGVFAWLNKGADDANLERLTKELSLLKQRQSFFQARQVYDAGPVGGGRGLDYSGKPSVRRNTEAGSGNGVRPSAPRESELDKYIERLEATRSRLMELSTAEQALRDIQAGRITAIDTATGKTRALSAAERERVLSVARGVDADKAAIEVAKQQAEAAESAEKAWERAVADASRVQIQELAEVERLWEAVLTPAEAYTRELERIQHLVDNGAFGDPDIADVAQKIERIKDAAKKRLAETSKAGTEELDEFAKQAQRNIQDALGDTLTSALKGDFDHIGQMWLDLVQRMAAQALAANLNAMLFGGSGSSGRGDFGSIMGLIGLFGGGTTSTTTPDAGMGGNFDEMLGVVGGRATGGPVEAGKAYLVGEQGPEVVRFGQAGMVMNHRDSMRALGGRQTSIAVHINQSVGEFVTPSQAANLARATKDAAVAAVRDAMRRGA